jgi:hypothetical protein
MMKTFRTWYLYSWYWIHWNMSFSWSLLGKHKRQGGVLSYWPKLLTFTIKQDFGGLHTRILFHWKQNTGCPELRTLIFQWDEVWSDGRGYSNKYRPNLYFSWVELFVMFCLDRKFSSWTLLPFVWWGISRNVKWPCVCSQTIFCIGQQKGVMGLSGLRMGSDEVWPSWKAIGKNAGMMCSLWGSSLFCESLLQQGESWSEFSMFSLSFCTTSQWGIIFNWDMKQTNNSSVEVS